MLHHDPFCVSQKYCLWLHGCRFCKSLLNLTTDSFKGWFSLEFIIMVKQSPGFYFESIEVLVCWFILIPISYITRNLGFTPNYSVIVS